MHPILKAHLLDYIAKWCTDAIESEHWPQESFAHPTLCEQMMEGAALVFDTADASSVYTRSEERA